MKYEVLVTVTIDKEVIVEAEDEWEAKAVAEDIIAETVPVELNKYVTAINAWDTIKYRGDDHGK